MKKINQHFTKFFFVLCVFSFLTNCKKEDEEIINPVLRLTGVIASENLTTVTGDTIAFSWIAEKGTNPLQNFSIQINDEYLAGWNKKMIPASYSEEYTDTLLVIMPKTEGSYIFKLTVTDKNSLTAEKLIEVTVEKPPITNSFVYYNNSTFIYIIKDGTGSPTITRMTWTVIDYNSSTNVATLTSILDPETTGTPIPQTFNFRKVSSGALEYSKDGAAWVNLTDINGEINFLFGSKAIIPSSLLGDVITKIEPANVSYPEGISLGYKVLSEYDASGNDRYFYSNSSVEHYCEATGFTKAVKFISDFENYPVFSFKREVELVTYTIYLPDGSIREGGKRTPNAPTALSGSYKSESKLDFESLVWRTYYWVELNWEDNSDNEIQFDVYLKVNNGEFYPLSEITDKNLHPYFFPENSTSGEIEWGSRVGSAQGIYTFKIKAVGAVYESDFSNEVIITVN
ncbi:hypothetical protein ES705_33249 [subsurface metagenome]